MPSEFRCVYIFRGLPGSGKSYRASLLALEAQKKGQSVRYCSEEFFFVGSDGKFRFNHSKVDEARLSCIASLQQALCDGVQLVCVDNISATQASYSHFLQLAVANNYEVKVVEMPCPDLLNLQHFFARSRKTTPGEGYSYDYVLSLWSLWEPHSDLLLSSVNVYDPSVSFDEHTSSRNKELTRVVSQPSQYNTDVFSRPFSQPNLYYTEELRQSALNNHERLYLDQSHHTHSSRHHAKKEELLQQLFHLKQQEVVLQQQLKQQKLCDQLSSRPRRFSNRQQGTTTVVLAPYTAPQVSRGKYDKQPSFSFPLMEKY